MTSKEKLDYMYGIAICGSGLGETADKVRECYNKIADDLERLEQIDNAKPSEALEILETFNGGLLNKKIGAISYNQIWLENQIEALKQALLKAQEQDKILEILKEHIKLIDYGIFNYKIVIYLPVHYTENLKEWLDKK